MKNRHTLIAIALTFLITILTLLITGCNKNVSWDTLEAQRQTAIDNSSFNANVWRNSYAPNLLIKSRGDSSIKENCPSGDGWATIDLIDSSGAKRTELKCSTVSATIACLETSDFQKRYKDGTCDTNLPFPIPKAVK